MMRELFRRPVLQSWMLFASAIAIGFWGSCGIYRLGRAAVNAEVGALRRYSDSLTHVVNTSRCVWLAPADTVIRPYRPRSR